MSRLCERRSAAPEDSKSGCEFSRSQKAALDHGVTLVASWFVEGAPEQSTRRALPLPSHFGIRERHTAGAKYTYQINWFWLGDQRIRISQLKVNNHFTL